MAVIFGIAGFVLYQIRSSESHGKSISFPKIKEVLRFALLLLFGLFALFGFYYLTGANMFMGIVGAAFCMGLGHGVIQLIYEVDFRAIRKKWFTTGISFAAVILIFLGFRYDWTGYDNRIPKQSEVESVYLSLVAEGFYNNTYVASDGTESTYWRHRKNMNLTQLDTIYELLEKRENIKKKSENSFIHYDSMEITFRLKNGKTQSRRLYINHGENLGLLDEIYHMEEYQLANNQVLEDDFVKKYKIHTAAYDNGFHESNLSGVDINDLIEAYRKDFENASYTEVYYSIPAGRLTVYGTGLKRNEYTNRWSVLIYESYENTIRLLEKAGVSYKAELDKEYMENIWKAEVNYHDYVQAEEEGRYIWDQGTKKVSYEDKEQCRKILESAVCGNNRWWAVKSRQNTQEYSAYIFVFDPEYEQGSEFFSADGGITTVQEETEADYLEIEVDFPVGEVPEFVLKDLETVEFGETVTIP